MRDGPLVFQRGHSSIKIFPNRVKSHIRLVNSDKIMLMFKGCSYLDLIKLNDLLAVTVLRDRFHV